MKADEWKQWEQWGDSVRAEAIHDILNGMFRGERRAGSADGEFIPGKGIDIVKIFITDGAEDDLRRPFLQRLHQRRLVADLWRGTQHVRAPLLPDKVQEFVERLKDDGFQEKQVSAYHRYLWRKHS